MTPYEKALQKIEKARQTQATELDLPRMGLEELPPEIGQLTNLTKLNLWGNQLTSLPPEIGQLTNLTELYLHKNQLTILPREITYLTGLAGEFKEDWRKGKPRLQLKDNPLEQPPIEIAVEGFAAVKNWFETVYVSQIEKLYEAKLLIVGAANVGKTCLAHALCEPDFNLDAFEQEQQKMESTEGIDIRQWVIPKETFRNDIFQKNDISPPEQDFIINLWDFGGQEIYHATHQFFLTKRSLYLFVWHAREDDLRDFSYWLHVIKLLSDNSPVLVVMNKADQRRKALDQAGLQDTFRNIVGFHTISVKTGEGVADLRQHIQQIMPTLEHVGTDWPTVWTKIRRQLEADDRHYISHDKFVELCQPHNLNARQADFLSDFLHDLGVVLHFQDDPLLAQTLILDPDWGTNAVYKVLDAPRVQQNKGRFHYHDLRDIWADPIYPAAKHPELLQLMVKFELAFRLGQTQQYIVPERLPAQRPKFNWPDSVAVRFEYHYPFMPAGIVTRFMVRLHHLIEDAVYWRNGVVMQRDSSRALIISDPIKQIIRIAICGERAREFLAIIRQEIEYIHGTLNNPPLSEEVPLPAHPHTTIAYADLLTLEEEGILDYFVPAIKARIDVTKLLDGIESAAQRRRRRTKYDPYDYRKEPVMGASERLKMKIDSYNDSYSLLMEKLKSIEQAYRIETDPARKFQYKHQLTEAERELDELDAKLKKLEQDPDTSEKDMTEVKTVQKEVRIVYNVLGDLIKGDKNVNQKNINIGDGATISGNVVIADAIENSFNTIHNANAGEELKTLLTQLTTEVKAIAEKLPPDEAEEVGDDLERFVEETTKDKPKRKWYSVSGEGIVEAAKAVGDAGKNILELVPKVMALLP